jgi:hypothetical protein
MTEEKKEAGRIRQLWRLIVGTPRDINDPGLFQHMSLAVFVAWVGLEQTVSPLPRTGPKRRTRRSVRIRTSRSCSS